MKRIAELCLVFALVLAVFSCNNIFYSSSFVRIATQDNKDKNGNLLDHWVYNYDSSGKLESVVDYNSSSAIQGTSKYSYDSNGKRISSSNYSSSNALIGYTTYEYSNGKISKGNYYYIVNGAYTTISSYTNYTFQNGRKVKTETYNATSGKLTYSMTFSYDSFGKREKALYDDGKYFEWTYPSNTQIVATYYDSSNVKQSERTLNFESESTTENYLDFMNF
jgi:hypothetical protein